MVSAPANSSFNIYMIGREKQIGGPRTNVMWVLTLRWSVFSRGRRQKSTVTNMKAIPLPVAAPTTAARDSSAKRRLFETKTLVDVVLGAVLDPVPEAVFVRSVYSNAWLDPQGVSAKMLWSVRGITWVLPFEFLPTTAVITRGEFKVDQLGSTDSSIPDLYDQKHGSSPDRLYRLGVLNQRASSADRKVYRFVQPTDLVVYDLDPT